MNDLHRTDDNKVSAELTMVGRPVPVDGPRCCWARIVGGGVHGVPVAVQGVKEQIHVVRGQEVASGRDRLVGPAAARSTLLAAGHLHESHCGTFSPQRATIQRSGERGAISVVFDRRPTREKNDT